MSTPRLQEGPHHIPLPLSIKVTLAHASPSGPEQVTLPTQYPALPLIRFSRLAKRSILDSGLKELTLDCDHAEFQTECVVEVLRYLCDVAACIGPKHKGEYPTLSPDFQKEVMADFHVALSVWHIICVLELVDDVRNGWIRDCLVLGVKTYGVSPTAMRRVYCTLWDWDVGYVRALIRTAARSWTSDLPEKEIEVVREIRLEQPELWFKIRALMNTLWMKDREYAQKLIGLVEEEEEEERGEEVDALDCRGVYNSAEEDF
jgi:hypothetical protein